jgi:hypothetical protein
MLFLRFLRWVAFLTPAEPMQQKQKPRRVSEYWCAEAMVLFSFVD